MEERERERRTERQRDRERERERDRQTDRQTDKEKGMNGGEREGNRERERERERERGVGGGGGGERSKLCLRDTTLCNSYECNVAIVSSKQWYDACLVTSFMIWVIPIVKGWITSKSKSNRN